MIWIWCRCSGAGLQKMTSCCFDGGERYIWSGRVAWLMVWSLLSLLYLVTGLGTKLAEWFV